MNKFALQDSQYSFPYHYLPHLGAHGVPMRSRGLGWGFEYLCYQHHVAAAVRDLRPGSVLEVGCGDGRFIGMLGEVASRVGVDLSAQAIRFAQAFHPEVDFRCAPVADIQQRFDVVAAIEVLEHVGDEHVAGFLCALADRTRADGHIVLSVPSDAVPVHPKHYRHYNEALLRRQIGESGAPVDVLQVDHVYGPPRWLDTVLRYTCNSLLTFELRPLNRWIWNYLWRRARFARPGRGRHLVAVLRRSSAARVESAADAAGGLHRE